MSNSRLFKILYYILEKGHATAPELAAELEVSVRTVYRDIEALSGAGIPVYAEPGRNGGIYLLRDFVLDRAILSEDERQEVLAAVQGISATGYAAGQETLTKLAALFNLHAQNWLEVDFSRWSKSACDSPKFEVLRTAVLQHREIRMAYVSARGERRERTVQPLKLSYRSKDWYLKAFCLERQDFRMFKLNRISAPELLEKVFVPRQYPEPEDMPPQACQRITILFSKEIAYRAYDEFDEAQITYRDNGDLIASAEMPADAWLTGYLLSLGPQAQIIEPSYLREALAEQALEIYKKYKP